MASPMASSSPEPTAPENFSSSSEESDKDEWQIDVHEQLLAGRGNLDNFKAMHTNVERNLHKLPFGTEHGEGLAPHAKATFASGLPLMTRMSEELTKIADGLDENKESVENLKAQNTVVTDKDEKLLESIAHLLQSRPDLCKRLQKSGIDVQTSQRAKYLNSRDKLEAENVQLQLTVKQLEEEVASNADILEEQAAQLENVQAGQPDSQEMNRLQQNLDAAKLETSNYIAVLEDERKAHKATKVELKKEIDEHKGTYNFWQEEIEEVNTARKLGSEARSAQLRAETDLKNEKSQHKTTRDTLTQVQQQMAQMKEDGITQDAVEKLHKDIQESSKNLTGVKTELEQAVKEKRDVEKDLEEARAQKAAQDDTLRKTEKEVDRLHTNISSVEEKASSLETKLESAKLALETKVSDWKKVDVERSTAQKNLSALQTRFDQLTSDLGRTNTSLMGAQDKVIELQTSLTTEQEKCKASEIEENKLRNELTDVTKSRDQFDQENKTLRAEKTIAQEDHNTLSTDLTNLRRELEEEKLNHKAAREARDDMQKERDSIDSDFSRHQTMHQDHLTACTASISASESEIARLRRLLEDEEEGHTTLKRKYDSIEAEHSTLKDKRQKLVTSSDEFKSIAKATEANLQKEIDGLKESKSNVERTNNQLIQDLKTADNAKQKLESDLQTSMTKVNELSGKLETSTKTISGLRTDLVNANKKLETDTETINALTTDLSNTKEKLEDSIKTINSLRTDLTSTNGKLEDLEKTASRLRTDISNANKKLETGTETINSLRTDLSSANAKLENDINTIAGLRTDLADANKKLETDTETINELTTDLSDANEKLQTNTGTINGLMTDISDANKKLQTDTETINGLRIEVDGLKNKISDANRDIKKGEETVKALKAEIEGLKTKVSDAEEAMKTSESVNNGLEHSLNSTRTEVNALTNQVAAKEQDLRNSNLIASKRQKVVSFSLEGTGVSHLEPTLNSIIERSPHVPLLVQPLEAERIELGEASNQGTGIELLFQLLRVGEVNVNHFDVMTTLAVRMAHESSERQHTIIEGVYSAARRLLKDVLDAPRFLLILQMIRLIRRWIPRDCELHNLIQSVVDDCRGKYPEGPLTRSLASLVDLEMQGLTASIADLLRGNSEENKTSCDTNGVTVIVEGEHFVLVQGDRAVFVRGENLICETFEEEVLFYQFRVRGGPLNGWVTQRWDFMSYTTVSSIFDVSLAASV